jgi:FkbM family methyltransferase
MKNYSQSSEQDVILEYFGGHTGIFMDIGANDSETLSNTRALALLGWGGLAVEPTKTAFAKLKKIYEKDDFVQCMNVAVADYCGKASFFENGSHLHQGDTGLLSTLRKSETERWKNTEHFTETVVDVIDVKTLLERSFYKTFDFISIDIEGMDYDVLAQLPLEELQTRLVCVEFNQKDKKKFEDLMYPQGFTLLHENYENLIFCK